MQDSDREAFKRSLQGLRSSDPLRNNGAARRPNTAITRQMREDTVRTNEDLLARVRVAVRKLRVALARNHKQTINAAAALSRARRHHLNRCPQRPP
jgi:hypothetical protein